MLRRGQNETSTNFEGGSVRPIHRYPMDARASGRGGPLLSSPPCESEVGMELAPGRSSWYQSSRFHTAIIVCLVGTLSYVVSELGGALVFRPQMLSPLWPGCVLLVSVLLLVPRRMWPILIAAGIAAFIFYDLRHDVPIRAIGWLIFADLVEVAIAALCLSYSFNGVPRLNSVRALATYSFFAVILAPAAGALVGALATRGSYWTNWTTSFLSEALGFLTLTPAILGWAGKRPAAVQKGRANYLEAAALLAALAFFGFLTFVALGRSSPPALVYSLLPFLLWAALRFGSTGVSTSMIVVALLAIWGVVHGRGPFTGPDPLDSVLSLQLFLLFATAPFMVLAVIVEERKRGEEELRESEAKFRSVFQDAGIGVAIVSPEGRFLAGNGAFSKFIGYTEEELIGRTVQSVTHPEDWPMFSQRLNQALATGASFQGVEKRCLHKNGQVLSGECSASLIRDIDGKPQYFVAEVLDTTVRKRAEQTLRESEERFRLVANKAPVLIWMSGTDKLCTFFNQCWLDFTGRSMDQELKNGWAAGVHPEDLARCLGIYSSAFDTRVDFEMEYRLRRFDGKYRWIVDYGVPRFESDGAFCGYIGSCVDITDRKLAAESLEELSGRLITAQDEERTRIARELHDDFSQRLALQGIGLAQVWKKMPESEVAERAKVQELLKGIQEISSDMHSLSHQLHSSKLEHVGLVPALMGLCEELSSRFKVQIKFSDHGLSSGIPKDVGLCLFRIAQEALGNVVKHSGAKEAHAELCGTRNEIRLRIVDAGFGFDPELRNENAGLGLVSMRERLRLIGGRLSVQSAPMRGTEILAEVPLSVSAGEPRVKLMTAGGIKS
jgi:PAS domain S-box-containing protein